MQAVKKIQLTDALSQQTQERASKLFETLRGLFARKRQASLLAALALFKLGCYMASRGAQTRAEVFGRVARLNAVMARFSDRALAGPSTSLRRAFFRWRVRANPSLARECVEKIIASVSVKKEVSIWRLMRLRNFALFKRKARFIAFVEKLVELTASANAKILHSHKNLFFFSLLLISAKAEREDFNRKLGGFVRVANARLALKTTALVNAIVPHNPKQTLLALLAKNMLKKAHTSFGALQLLAKKGRILCSYKFVGLMNEKMAAKTKTVFDGLVPLRRRFLGVLVDKLRLALKRTLRQLANRSLFLLSQKEGLAQFISKIENADRKLGARKGLKAIKGRLEAQRNIEKLGKKLDVLGKSRDARHQRETFSLLRQKVQLILMHKRQGIARNISKMLKGKMRIVLERISRLVRKTRLAQTLLARRLSISQREKLFNTLLVLRHISGMRAFAESKEKKTQIQAGILYRLTSARRWKLREVIDALQRKNVRFIEQRDRLEKALFKVRRRLLLSGFENIKRFVLTSDKKSRTYLQYFSSLQTRLSKIRLSKLNNAIESLKSRAHRPKTFLAFIASFFDKKNTAQAKIVFTLFKYRVLQRSITEAKTQTTRFRQQNFFKLLLARLQAPQKTVLQKFQVYRARQKSLSVFLINALKRKTLANLKLYLASLQRNRLFYAHTTSQERRKASLISLAQVLLRCEARRKGAFLRLLQKHTQKTVQGAQLLRKLAENKYRKLIIAGLSRLIDHSRRGKLWEFSTILDKTTTDLSDFNRVFRPKYNRTVLRRLLYGPLLNSYKEIMSSAVQRLRRKNAQSKRLSTILANFHLAQTQRATRLALARLKEHSAFSMKHVFETNLQIWSLEKLIRTKQALNKMTVLKHLSRQHVLRRMLETFIKQTTGRAAKLSLQATFLRLKSFAREQTAMQSANGKARSSFKAANVIQSLFATKLAEYQQAILDRLKSRLHEYLLLKRLLPQTYKKILLAVFMRLSKHRATSMLAQDRSGKIEAKKQTPVHRLVYATAQKQSQIIQRLSRHKTQHILAVKKVESWNTLYRGIKAHVLKSILSCSYRFSRSCNRRKVRERVIFKFIALQLATTSNYFSRLRRSNKTVKHIVQRLAGKLSHGCRGKLNRVFTNLKQLTFLKAGRDSRMSRLLFTLEKILRQKIALLQADFLSKIISVKQREAIVKSTGNKTEAKNFRKKAGSFLEKLSEHQTLAQNKLRVFHQLERTTNLSLRQVLFLLQKLMATSKNKNLKIGSMLCMPLALTLKTKQRLALALLRRCTQNHSAIKSQLSVLSLSTRVKKTQALFILRNKSADVEFKSKDRIRWFVDKITSCVIRQKRAAFKLLGKITSRRGNLQRRLIENLAARSQRKKLLALQRLKKPDFHTSEKLHALSSLLVSTNKMQQTRTKSFIDIIKKLSPIFVFKTWSRQFQKLQAFFNNRLLGPFLLIQQRSRLSDKDKKSACLVDRLIAARFVRIFIARRNGPDPRELLHPCLLALLSYAFPDRLEPAQQKFLNTALDSFTAPTNKMTVEDLQALMKRTDLKELNLRARESKGGLLIGNGRLLDQMQALRLEAARLEAEKAHLAQNHHELEGLLLNYQTQQADLEAKALLQTGELKDLEVEKRNLEESIIRAQAESSGLPSPRPTQPSIEIRQRLARLAKEKRELEGQLGRYASDTRGMEDELGRLEREEQSFIEKILGLQGDHLSLQQQLVDNECSAKSLQDENRRLRLDHSAALGQLEVLTLEARDAAAQLRGLEEEGRRNAGRESALQETNSSLTRRNQQLTDENADLLHRQNQLLAERDDLLAKNKELNEQAKRLTAEREALAVEKEALLKTEGELRRLIMTRTESKSRLQEDNAYLLSQRSLQLDGQEGLIQQIHSQPGGRRKSAIANEQLGSIFAKLRVIDENISHNNQQIYSEEREIQRAEGELHKTASGIARADSRLRNLDERLGQVQTVLKENADRVNTLGAQISRSGGKVAENNAQIDANGRLIGENKALLEEIEATLLGLRAHEADAGDKFGRARLEIENLNIKIESNSGKLAENQKSEAANLENKGKVEKRLQQNEGRRREAEQLRGELAARTNILTADRARVGQESLVASTLLAEKATQLESLPPEEELELEPDIEDPLETSNFNSRQDITRRMTELRENLEKASRAIEEKRASLQKSEFKVSKNQLKIEDKRQIVGQAADRLTSIQNLIDLNLKNIDSQAEQVRLNETALAEKERRIAQNQEEIRRLNQQLEQLASPQIATVQKPPPTTFKKVLSKKVQTFAIEQNEIFSQTDLLSFDITKLEKRATQKHVIKTIEPVAPKVIKTDKGIDARADVVVQYFKKEAPRSFVMEETIAPIVQRIRQMTREPSLRKDLPLATPDDPLNLPFLAKDRHLDRIAKLYNQKLEPSTEEKDTIGLLKRNPFVKIEKFFFEANKNERKTRSNNQVANISSYFVKGAGQGPPTPIAKQFRDMLVNTELELWDPAPLETSQQASFDLPRPEIVCPKILLSQGPTFFQAKTEQSLKLQQEVYSFLFPKSEMRVLPPLPSIRELVRVNDFVKETATNATQTELDPISHLGLTMLANIFRRRDAKDLQFAAAGIKELTQPPRGPKPELTLIRPLRLFNNKKNQFQFQLKALKQTKNETAARLNQTALAIIRRNLKEQLHHMRMISNLDACKLYLNALFRWKLQNVDFNHRRQLDRIKSVHIGLDSIFSRLVYKRLGLVFRQLQRQQDQRAKNIYSLLFPLMFRADAAYRLNLRNVFHYWHTVKDENRWFTKIVRGLVYKSSLEPQIALWRLKFFKPPVKVTPPKVFAGATRLLRFFKDKEKKLINECAAILASLVRLPTPDVSAFHSEPKSPRTEESELADRSENDEELSRANAKVLVLSIKGIFRTLDDRWKVRTADALARLRLNIDTFALKHTIKAINRPERVSSWPDDNNSDFLLEQNHLCKRELEKKEKLLEESRLALDGAKQDAVFLRNSFIYVVLNRIQCLISTHTKKSALPLKRSAFNLIRQNAHI